MIFFLSVVLFFLPISVSLFAPSVFIPQGVLSQSEANLPNYKPHLLSFSHTHRLHPLLHTCTRIPPLCLTHTQECEHKYVHTSRKKPTSLFCSSSLSVSLPHNTQTNTLIQTRTPTFPSSLCHTLKSQLYTLPPFSSSLLLSLSSPSCHHNSDLGWTKMKTREKEEKTEEEPEIEDRVEGEIWSRGEDGKETRGRDVSWVDWKSRLERKTKRRDMRRETKKGSQSNRGRERGVEIALIARPVLVLGWQFLVESKADWMIMMLTTELPHCWPNGNGGRGGVDSR